MSKRKPALPGLDVPATAPKRTLIGKRIRIVASAEYLEGAEGRVMRGIGRGIGRGGYVVRLDTCPMDERMVGDELAFSTREIEVIGEASDDHPLDGVEHHAFPEAQR